MEERARERERETETEREREREREREKSETGRQKGIKVDMKKRQGGEAREDSKITLCINVHTKSLMKARYRNTRPNEILRHACQI